MYRKEVLPKHKARDGAITARNKRPKHECVLLLAHFVCQYMFVFPFFLFFLSAHKNNAKGQKAQEVNRGIGRGNGALFVFFAINVIFEPAFLLFRPAPMAHHVNRCSCAANRMCCATRAWLGKCVLRSK